MVRSARASRSERHERKCLRRESSNRIHGLRQRDSRETQLSRGQ